MNSFWNTDIKAPKFNELKCDKKTDVLIIGGGISGLLCAYFLEKSGVDSILVEADKICSGVTRNTTAKISSQHGLIYSDLIKKIGEENANGYLKANEEAIACYRELSKNIDCDFKNESSFVYSLDGASRIEEELNALYRLGFPASFTKNTSLPFPISGAVEFPLQAHFNPMKFAYSIARDLNIYENTKVKKLERGLAITEHGKIKAEKVIVATHFPFIDKHGLFFLKMYQHRSYVIALKNAKDFSGMYIDKDEKGLSFRNYKDYLLLGGGSHRTGERGGAWSELLKFKEKYYPKAKEAARFATQDCITLDGVPYIGKYSKFSDNLYVATGYNKWGMTSSMVAGKLICDMITGKYNPYEEIFSPQRSIFRKKLITNIGKTLVNFITPKTPRCSHLGCALKYNREEHSWDCPCHGSRFREDGKLLEAPAQTNAKIKKKKSK